ncbi:YceI family protein [Antribacter gilvus]|uniref:YceI family protein n=1 Tax=Antribacter gilvus TaxID=2304675 RepID=UPI0030B8594B
MIPAPGVYTLDPAHKRLGFLAMHMMVSPVRGEFGDGAATVHVADDPLSSQISATIAAATINTLNPERDAHLMSPDFLDVVNHPTIEFRSTGMKLKDQVDPIFSWARLKANASGHRPANLDEPDRSTGRFVVPGELTIKGVTRAVELECQFGGARRDPYGRDIFGFSATCEIDREDYGLLWNVALETGGVLVARKVRIELAGEAIREA